MKKTKELFGITAIVCALSFLINIIYFVEAINNAKVFYAILYALFILSSFLCVVMFLIFFKQSIVFLKKHKTLIKSFCICAIVCSFLGGIIGFYAYYTLFPNSFSFHKADNIITENIDGVEVINDKRMAKYIDDINHLEKLKESGTISQEYYEKLKKQIISKYLSKGD